MYLRNYCIGVNSSFMYLASCIIFPSVSQFFLFLLSKVKGPGVYTEGSWTAGDDGYCDSYGSDGDDEMLMWMLLGMLEPMPMPRWFSGASVSSAAGTHWH